MLALYLWATCGSSNDCSHREDDIVALELFPEHALVSDVPTHELKIRIGDVLEKAGLAVGKVVQNGHGIPFTEHVAHKDRAYVPRTPGY